MDGRAGDILTWNLSTGFGGRGCGRTVWAFSAGPIFFLELPWYFSKTVYQLK